LSERVRILTVTTSRADYGIYRPVLRALVAHSGVELGLLVSGTHLSPTHGETVSEIERDGFSIVGRVPMTPANDAPSAIAAAMGRCTLGCVDVIQAFAPDCMMVLGDRYEMHAAATAAVPFGVPLAHIHGGELTQGAIDDAFRHSLTKLSHLHFVSTREYADRVAQMGEESWRITVSGAPGLDNLMDMELPSAQQLEAQYHFKFGRSTLLATYHPTTLDVVAAEFQVEPMLSALGESGLPVVFTGTNIDPGAQAVRERISRFVANHTNAIFIESMGTRNYLGAMRCVGAMVGNSSSGILEAASFNLPVINIGERQAGRVRPRNVLDVPNDTRAIAGAIVSALSDENRRSLADIDNPYYCGGAGPRIASVMARLPARDVLVRKKFVDLPIAFQPSWDRET
jgi:UDP-hydrolysing UDP-N-acetyl-D-glucosamine 2-epimerase